MSRFTEAIAAEPVRPDKGPTCTVGHFRESLDGDDLDDFDGLLAEARSGNRTMASVARVLQRVGVDLKADRLLRHAKRECKCPTN